MPRRRAKRGCCSKRGVVIYFRHAHGRRDGTLSDVPFEVFLSVHDASWVQAGEWRPDIGTAPTAQGCGAAAHHFCGFFCRNHLHIAARVLIALVAFSLAYSAFRVLNSCLHGRIAGKSCRCQCPQSRRLSQSSTPSLSLGWPFISNYSFVDFMSGDKTHKRRIYSCLCGGNDVAASL
jgi:hypothetical protein